jgi:hypothetical protein
VPVEVSFIGLPVHFPASVSNAGPGQGAELRWHQQLLAVAVGSGEDYSLGLGFFEAGEEQDPCLRQIYVVGYLAIVFLKVVYQLLFSSCLGSTSFKSSRKV